MLVQIQKDLTQALEEFFCNNQFSAEHLIVIGCSTSEVIGEKIGTSGSQDVAAFLWDVIASYQGCEKFNLAIQCCEHLNRALVVEKQTMIKFGLKQVSAIPHNTAGGAFATYAYHQFTVPCLVESVVADAGIDIGDTFVAMHIRPIVIPVRLSQKNIGEAHLTAAITRPPLIGGARAKYEI